MYTTLNRIREHKPCKGGWESLLKYLGKTKPDDEPLPLLTILDSNGLDHALWCFRAVDGFAKEKLLLAIAYAREVEHLMPAKSKKALDGLATEKEFEKAAARAVAARANVDAVAAWEAVWAARADAAAARAADVRAAAAAAAAWAAYAAAWEAARAARAAAADAAAANAAAANAARAAAWEAAYSTTLAKQESQLRELLEKTCTNATTENSKH